MTFYTVHSDTLLVSMMIILLVLSRFYLESSNQRVYVALLLTVPYSSLSMSHLFSRPLALLRMQCIL
jgi:hypothetical protein